MFQLAANPVSYALCIANEVCDPIVAHNYLIKVGIYRRKGASEVDFNMINMSKEENFFKALKVRDTFKETFDRDDYLEPVIITPDWMLKWDVEPKRPMRRSKRI